MLGASLKMIPGYIDRWGLAGGLRRWRGVVRHRAADGVSGRSIFDTEWDLCIILDACRVDELRRLASSYDWLTDVGSFPSVASCTWDWMPRTFTNDASLADVAYVTANPFSEQFCDADEFATLDEVWRYAWDDERGTVRPRPVTDRAIHHGRETDADRLLVHYIQPHVPFLVENSQGISRGNFSPNSESALDDWDRVTRGELNRKTAIDWYRQTLETALKEVDLLLSNVDANHVVVSADHGEAFGEAGVYGHPSDVDLPCLTTVPYVGTTAADEQSHTPERYDRDGTNPSRDEQLQALGYH